MELILWRHAEAEDGIPDMARALTDKGYRQARQMAAWLKPRLPADTRILVSPARRTQQTAAALGLDFITLDEIAPGASPDEVLAAAGWPRAGHSVLVVGHQPTLGEVASRLLQSSAPALGIRKGAVWWFACRHGDMHDITLRAMVTPEIVRD